MKDATKRLQFLDEFPFDMPIRSGENDRSPYGVERRDNQRQFNSKPEHFESLRVFEDEITGDFPETLIQPAIVLVAKLQSVAFFIYPDINVEYSRRADVELCLTQLWFYSTVYRQYSAEDDGMYM